MHLRKRSGIGIFQKFKEKHMHQKIQPIKKKKKSIPINFNANYRRELKLVPINKDHCLLKCDALKF